MKKGTCFFNLLFFYKLGNIHILRTHDNTIIQPTPCHNCTFFPYTPTPYTFILIFNFENDCCWVLLNLYCINNININGFGVDLWQRQWVRREFCWTTSALCPVANALFFTFFSIKLYKNLSKCETKYHVRILHVLDPPIIFRNNTLFGTSPYPPRAYVICGCSLISHC